MATTVDQLIVEIRAETKQLRKGLDEANRQLANTGKAAKRSLIPLGSFTKMFAAIGAIAGLRAVTNVSRQFEDLEATLRAVTGSAQNARLAFKTVEEFTKTTPFQLANVTESFIRFFQAGIEPNNRNLKAFGNLAAGMGKDITQLAQATFNATTGEMEMLKQFGIKAKLMGDEIAVTFEGQTTVIERTGEAIGNFLIELGETRFPTALEERLNTLSGAISNLGDVSSIAMNEIGKGGLNAGLTDLAKTLEAVIKEGTPLANTLGGVGEVFHFLAGAIHFANKGIGAFIVLSNKIKINAEELAVAAADLGDSLFGSFKQEERMQNRIKALEKIQDLQEENLNIIEMLDKADAEREKRLKNFRELQGGSDGEGGGSITPPKGAEKEVHKLTKAFEELDVVISEAGQNLSRDFTDSLLAGESALDSFKNFAKAIVSEIIATFLNLAIIQPIIEGLFTGFSTRLPAGDNVNMSTTPGTSITAPAMAGGGRASHGNAMLVGERGPELFVPHAPGTIMNAADTRSANMGGSVIVNQSISFSTGVVPTVRAEVQRLMPQISDVTKASVLEATMRGGSYQKGIRGHRRN